MWVWKRCIKKLEIQIYGRKTEGIFGTKLYVNNSMNNAKLLKTAWGFFVRTFIFNNPIK